MLPPDPVAMTPEERRLAIDERKLAIEERRIKLDESFAKKWGGFVLPVLATICTAIISAVLTLNTNYIADIQKKIENNRSVIELYFKVFPRKDMGLDKGSELKVSAIEFDMLEKITTDPDLRESLSQMKLSILNTAVDNAVGNVNSNNNMNSPEFALTDLAGAIAGLPDFTQAPNDGQYKAADFLAYPQVPIMTDAAMVGRMLDALSAFGFKAQAPQRMKAGVSPNQSEVRYYRPEHKELAREAADKLNQALNAHFVAKPVNIGKTLPNGIMEFWLGDKNP